MARVTLGTGDTITVGGVTEIFGTSGAQTVNILDGSTITFRSGFNSGGDTIRLSGKASDFLVSISGSNVTLTSRPGATDNITVVIPIGTVANTLIFDNGDTRSLSIVNGVPTLGAQALSGTPVALTAGPGVYEITSVSGEVTEGGSITFTVRRTDESFAETLQVTAAGFTNGGTVDAADQGADFTVAGGTLVFAPGQDEATFTISAPLDGEIEGLEGIRITVLNSAQQSVATTNALIIDATPEGQTFQLTPGLDTVGTGLPTDLIGSAGNAGTGGNDTIVAVTGEVNLINPNIGLTGTITPFDNINGGAGTDTFLVLDNGNPFTSQPNFFGVIVDNVEVLDYRAPTRGFLNGEFNVNTAGFDGLMSASFLINGSGLQTITLDDQTTSTAADGVTPNNINTSASIVQLGNGALVVNGGGNAFVAQAAGGDVTVGGTTASNTFTSVTIAGGNNIVVNDRGTQQLPTVALSGFAGNATLTGTAITSVSVQNLAGGSADRDINVTANNVTVSLNNIDVGTLNAVDDLDVIGSNLLTVIGNSSVIDLEDISAGNSVTVRSTGGTLFFDDLNVGGGVGSNRTATLDAAGGNLSFGDILGTDVRNVFITGSGFVSTDSVEQSGNNAGTVITSTNAGGVFIDTILQDNTQFFGQGNTGGDDVIFGTTIRANTFGGGNDNVRLTTASLGVNGSLDGGVGTDRLFMESNDAAAFTSGAVTATFNFEELELTGQDLAKADVINLDDIGFTNFTNVTSNVGAGSVPEITTLVFGGSATGADVVLINAAAADGLDALDLDVVLADNATSTDIAIAVEAAINAATGATGYSATRSGDVVTVTGPTGVNAGVTVSFTDSTSIGRPSLEQDVVTPVVTVQGQDAVTAVAAQFRLSLEGAFLNNGDDIEFQDADNNGLEIVISAPADLSWQNGELANFIISAVNAGDAGAFTFDSGDDFNWTASLADNGIDVIFTRDTAGVSTGVQIDTTGFTDEPNDGLAINDDFIGITDSAAITQERAGVNFFAGVQEEFTVIIDGFASGNDEFSFDGETVTFDGGEGPNDLAAEILAEFVPTDTWDAVSVVGSTVTFRANSVGTQTDVTANSFTFFDDNNIGTPTVTVTQVQNGELASVTLNSFVSGSTLTLNALQGIHSVLVRANANPSQDLINLVLNNDGDHGTLSTVSVETVNIDVRNNDNAANPLPDDNDALVLNNTGLTTLVVTGSDGLDLETNSTSIRSIDASALTGAFEWEADANTVNIIVKTGPGGSIVDFSDILLSGGNTFTNVEGNQTAPVLFIGGAGDDTIITGNVGTARGTITTGAGFDDIFVGVVDGGNDFWSITDFNVANDDLDFDGPTVFVGLDQDLEPTATFQDYLDQAARGAGPGFVAGAVRYFYWQGDTYVVKDNTDGEDFVDGSDTVIRIVGDDSDGIILTADNFLP